MTLLSQLLDSKGRAIHAIEPGAAVIDAIRSMAQNHVGALVVMDGRQLAGIVSERDYARKVILLGRSSSTTAVREIMSSPVFSVHPDQTVEECMDLMTRKHIRHLPVVDGEAIVGFVSIGDLVKYRIERIESEAEAMRSYIQSA